MDLKLCATSSLSHGDAALRERATLLAVLCAALPLAQRQLKARKCARSGCTRRQQCVRRLEVRPQSQHQPTDSASSPRVDKSVHCRTSKRAASSRSRFRCIEPTAAQCNPHPSSLLQSLSKPAGKWDGAGGYIVLGWFSRMKTAEVRTARLTLVGMDLHVVLDVSRIVGKGVVPTF